MNSSPGSRPAHSPVSHDSPQAHQARYLKTGYEDTEDHPTQSPAGVATQHSSSPSSPSMVDYASTNVANTNSTDSGSLVTQLTPSDDSSAFKGNPRERIPREARHHKTKASRRLSGLSSTESEPYSVTHDAFPSPSQELGYFKRRAKGPRTSIPEFPPTAVPVSNEPPFPQSPASAASYPGWAPDYPGAGYPPYQYSTPAGQQHALPPINHQYHSGYGYLDPKTTSLSSPFNNHQPLYDQPFPGAQEHMAARNEEPREGHILPLSDLTGYAKLAAAIADRADARVKPLYRRFDFLYHRTLLSYQDQLVVLEAELGRLDSTDARVADNAEARGVQPQPASAREERASGHGFHRDRSQIIDEIGRVLDRYTHLLACFETIQKLPTASAEEKRNYRTFVEWPLLLIDAEYQFIDQSDLVSLAQGVREVGQDAPPENAGREAQPAAAPAEVPLRTLMNAISVSFLCLAMLLVALPDFMSRFVMLLCFCILVLAILTTTGHIWRWRQ
ncbi:hypothetical protein FALBO_4544 [Fusarium albosuccineum]|uniref:DUF6594 domain-containing protein n=1 Tax=Fusarium albosuccineum TaxID=1237068 RepID=A0A8H4PG91_9HYPO|nr:hypothetical protein FALBO_4544 [Fusarium albosuccineum]